MNYELTQKAFDHRNFQRSYESARSLLKTSLSPLKYNHVCSVIETKALKIKERNSRKLEKKFNNLKRKFGIPKDVDRFDVKCSFELLYRDLVKRELPLTNENQDRLRSQPDGRISPIATFIHMTFRSRRTFSAKMNGKPYPIYAVMTASSSRNQS